MQIYKDSQMMSDENSAFEFAVISELGNREEQQDSFGYSLKYNEGIVVICDGMGGHEGGKLASSMIVEKIVHNYEQNYPCNEFGSFLIEQAKNADKKITSLCDATGKLIKGGSTMVTVAIKDKSLYWCSVGDSRAYLMRNDEFVQFTQDQIYKTVLDEQLRTGIISKEKYDNEMKRGETLISYIGVGNLSLIDYNCKPIKLKKDDKILIATDGLYKVVTDSQIKSILNNFSNLEDALQSLEIKVQRIAKNSDISRDNMTVALIKIK